MTNILSDIRCSTGDHKMVFDVYLDARTTDIKFVNGTIKCGNCAYIMAPCSFQEDRPNMDEHQFTITDITFDDKEMQVTVTDKCIRCYLRFRDMYEFIPKGMMKKVFNGLREQESSI